MGFNKTKNVVAVTSAIAIASCLLPEVAHAGLLRGNGRATNSSEFDIAIEDSISGVNGYFPGAIQKFDLTLTNVYTNEQICGASTCPVGDLTVSKLSTDSTGNITGLDFGLEELNNNFFSGFNTNFSVGDIRYDVNFVGTTPEPDLIWFIDFKAHGSINNLSALSRFDEIYGIYNPDVDTPLGSGDDFRFSVKPVPEPSNIAGVVCVGVLGVASLLKRNKNRKKLVHK